MTLQHEFLHLEAEGVNIMVVQRLAWLALVSYSREVLDWGPPVASGVLVGGCMLSSL